MMPWWAWSLVANVAINTIEYLNRTAGFATVWDAFKVTGPLIVLAQVGLFHAWQGAPSLMLAWIFFFACNTAMRLGSVHFLVGEPVTWRHLVGMVLAFVGVWLIKGASE